MSGGLARKMRRKRLVRADLKDDVVLATLRQVQVHEEILKTVVQALSARGILGELRSESGIILPGKESIK